MFLIEADYLPQSTAALFDGPWLVFAPHADDETFGMGGAIALARAAGIDVHVVVMTDGALGGVAEDSLVATREREVARALEVLGGASLECWRQPDRGLRPDDGLICRAAALLENGGYRSVFFPTLIEPHPDHRATARIVWEALRRTGFPAASFSYDISIHGPCNRLLDITPAQAEKKRAMAVYASQEAERPYAIKVLASNQARTWSLPPEVSYAESFFAYERSDCPLERVLEGILSGYLRGLRTTEEMGADLPEGVFPVRGQGLLGWLRRAANRICGGAR